MIVGWSIFGTGPDGLRSAGRGALDPEGPIGRSIENVYDSDIARLPGWVQGIGFHNFPTANGETTALLFVKLSTKDMLNRDGFCGTAVAFGGDTNGHSIESWLKSLDLAATDLARQASNKKGQFGFNKEDMQQAPIAKWFAEKLNIGKDAYPWCPLDPGQVKKLEFQVSREVVWRRLAGDRAITDVWRSARGSACYFYRLDENSNIEFSNTVINLDSGKLDEISTQLMPKPSRKTLTTSAHQSNLSEMTHAVKDIKACIQRSIEELQHASARLDAIEKATFDPQQPNTSTPRIHQFSSADRDTQSQDEVELGDKNRKWWKPPFNRQSIFWIACGILGFSLGCALFFLSIDYSKNRSQSSSTGPTIDCAALDQSILRVVEFIGNSGTDSYLKGDKFRQDVWGIINCGDRIVLSLSNEPTGSPNRTIGKRCGLNEKLKSLGNAAQGSWGDLSTIQGHLMAIREEVTKLACKPKN